MKYLLVLILSISSLFALPSDSPITPVEMQAQLGKGFDVSWVEFTKNIEAYSDLQVKAMKEMGFSTARIRTKLPADEYLFSLLDKVIADCFDNGIIPIIAYNAATYEAAPTAENREADRLWWKAIAERYQDYSYTLLFNLNIEWSDVGGKDIEGVNQWYETITPAIRESNPHRIILYSPIKLSNPEYLPDMAIPVDAGEYVMAEYHSYAAGPNADSLLENGKPNPKYWTTGTEYQKRLVQEMIGKGRYWQDSTGIPTWFGAWMAGNVNHGNTFTAQEQAVFATYFVHVLDSLAIPWAINTLDMYYDIDNNEWIDSMTVVREALSPAQAILISNSQQSITGVTVVSGAGKTLTLSLPEKGTQLSLFTASGRVLYSKSVSGSVAFIDRSTCTTGFYFIRCKGKKEYTQKIFVR